MGLARDGLRGAPADRSEVRSLLRYAAVMSPESKFRRVSRMMAWQLLAGLVLGVLFWELFGKALLSMKYGSVGSSVTCAPDVQRALAEFDSGLRLSALIGALAFVVVVALIRRKLHKRSESGAVVPAETGSKDVAPGPQQGI